MTLPTLVVPLADLVHFFDSIHFLPSSLARCGFRPITSTSCRMAAVHKFVIENLEPEKIR